MSQMRSIESVLNDCYRNEYGQILAGLISYLNDFSLAEEALQEAFISAMTAWEKKGIPRNPAAWLMTAAKRKGIDHIRHHRTVGFDPDDPGESAGLPLDKFQVGDQHIEDGLEEIPDDRLKLIFTCSHPALPIEQRVALTLHTLGGLKTPEIAAAFLVKESSMAQRLVRAKRKIKQAGIPYYVPPPHLLAERVESVLLVIYLIYTEGYSATSGTELTRPDLCHNAIWLCRTLSQLINRQNIPVDTYLKGEVYGLLALMLLQEARRPARLTENGDLVLLSDQDRSKWLQELVNEGQEILETALRLGSPGPYQLQAAINAIHAEAIRAELTDWKQIVLLYVELLKFKPNPIVRLNYAVALSMAYEPAVGLGLMEELKPDLDRFPPYHFALADMYHRNGQQQLAESAYHEAGQLTSNAAEQRFINKLLAK